MRRKMANSYVENMWITLGSWIGEEKSMLLKMSLLRLILNV